MVGVRVGVLDSGALTRGEITACTFRLWADTVCVMKCKVLIEWRTGSNCTESV